VNKSNIPSPDFQSKLSANAPVVTGITRIVINPSTNSTAPSESPTFEGRVFGNVGMYEKLRGQAYGQLDPNDTQNSLITDLQLAPRNNAGMVEYSIDFFILKPVNMSNGNHKLFFEINNRGNKVSGSFTEIGGGNNPTTARDAGQSFLLNQGYTIAWSAWDPSVPPFGNPDLLRISLPIATNSDGSSITGPSYEYISYDNPSIEAYRTTYNTSSTDTTKATLTVRNHLTDAPVIIPSTNWTWTSNNTISLLPLKTPFKQSYIYELVYTAKDPEVAGIGFAATRDFVSFLRSTRIDNPLAGDTKRVISWSISQPARYMNDFIWLGFNEDLKGQQVFDGVFNWVGGGAGIGLNYRFAQSGRTERNRQNHLYPEAIFPFSYTTLTDSFTGKTDGRNRRCMETNTCPKIMNINSANEYWVKTGSLLHSDLKGNDLIDPPNVRNFLISGSQHGGPSPANSLGICQQFGNTIDPNPVMHALFVALDQWLDGTEPPASMVPRYSDGTAVLSNITANSPLGIGTVSQTLLNWPTIPNVLYTGLITVRNFFNFGPQFNEGIISIEPPNPTGSYYSTVVSKVDIDGNELAGIRLPPVSVPFGTNAGWNLRIAAYAGNDGCEGSGLLIPFAPDMATRMSKGDPRLSLTERYGDHSGYVKAVTAAANALVKQRLLLSDGVQAYINAAQAPIQVINNPVYGNYTW
jgi:hypothetical protein